MKLIYAKLWLKKFIKYNHDNLDENKLNRAIINLSHRVYKSHGQRGHNVRQSIRSQLVEYSKTELARYDVSLHESLYFQGLYFFAALTVFLRYKFYSLRQYGNDPILAHFYLLKNNHQS